MTISPETGLLEEHSRELREPLPLSLHHLPVTIAFAFFDDSGELVVVDPSLAEEQSSAGTMMVRAAQFILRAGADSQCPAIAPR